MPISHAKFEAKCCYELKVNKQFNDCMPLTKEAASQWLLPYVSSPLLHPSSEILGDTQFERECYPLALAGQLDPFPLSYSLSVVCVT